MFTFREYLLAENTMVTITYISESDEYGVPEKNGEKYHTNDKQDAITTAKSIYGNEVTIKHTSK